MIARKASEKILDLARNFKAIAITGARQTGKTTLVKSLFKEKTYSSLENPDTLAFAIEDPRGFLASFPNGAILDEIQKTPELFSYLQEILDQSKAKGLFILTGSNNFLLHQKISQTLAGRIAIFNLPPFSLEELNTTKLLPENDLELIIKGFYPPIYDQNIPPYDWYPNYISTYVEKDVRQIKNITDLIVFERFLKLLSGRCGQELNFSSLSEEIGVDVKTIQSWIGILETSFIIHLLKPHHKNFNKILIKRPKIYFNDIGLACSLLGIKNIVQLENHPLKGSLFENMVINEFVKTRSNNGDQNNLYFWRDKTGHEIDLIIDQVIQFIPLEIKSSMTPNKEFFKNLNYWKKLSGSPEAFVLYRGAETQKRSDGNVILNWRKSSDFPILDQ